MSQRSEAEKRVKEIRRNTCCKHSVEDKIGIVRGVFDEFSNTLKT